MKKAGSIILLIMGIVCFVSALELVGISILSLLAMFVVFAGSLIIYFFVPDLVPTIAGANDGYGILAMIFGYGQNGVSNSDTFYYFLRVGTILTRLNTLFVTAAAFVIYNILVGVFCLIASRKKNMGLFITCMALGYFFSNYIILAGGVLGMIGCIIEKKHEREAEEAAKTPEELLPEPVVEEIS